MIYTMKQISTAADAMERGQWPEDDALASAALVYSQTKQSMTELKSRSKNITYREVKKEESHSHNPVGTFMTGASSALGLVVLGLGIYMWLTKGKSGAASLGALGDAVAG